MGVKIASAIVVLYVLVAVGVSFCFWEVLSKGEPSISTTIRNLILIWGAPLATGLAVWRSMVAQKQAEIAQAGLLSDRYQRAVEMLGHDLLSVRVGGIHALRNLALEHTEYNREVRTLLNIFGNGMGTGKNPKITVQAKKDKSRAYPADEWEAREAADALWKHGGRIARGSQFAVGGGMK